MGIIETKQIWWPQQLNSSGIRRLKIIDSRSVKILPFLRGASLFPIHDVVMYEFIFPSDLPCVASFTLSKKDTGATFWNQNITCTLPHIQDQILAWAYDNAQVQWLAIVESNNGSVRLMGGCPKGLDWNLQASTGGSPKDVNPQTLSFGGEQLLPYMEVAGYEDDMLFPTNSGYTYGFSLAFEA